MPVVFVNTPTDQPEYEELCKTFRRKGQTLFTGPLSRKMLFSAFRAARIHMLACWYELPRMASLTAVQFGCKVVVPENVTTREYLGDRAYYCEPRDPRSIREAVLGAWNDEAEVTWPDDLPVTTWAQTAEQVGAIYEKILLRGWTEEGRQEIKARATRVREELSYRHLRDEIHQRSEGSDQQTLEMSACLHAVRPDDPIVLFIQGMAYFGLSQMEDAEERLRRTLELAPYFDAKAYLYLGLIYLKQGKYRQAMNVLDRACRAHPFMPDDTAVLISNYLLLARQGAGELNLTPGGNGWSGTGPAPT
jgi:tetratricopeptide (TPR) repeat protein